jgi:hypothetical protein
MKEETLILRAEALKTPSYKYTEGCKIPVGISVYSLGDGACYVKLLYLENVLLS